MVDANAGASLTVSRWSNQPESDGKVEVVAGEFEERRRQAANMGA